MNAIFQKLFSSHLKEYFSIIYGVIIITHDLIIIFLFQELDKSPNLLLDMFSTVLSPLPSYLITSHQPEMR